MTAPALAKPAHAAASPSTLLSLSIFLISFATVLFTLSIWKLLTFFIMPSLFFDLLFVGFPIGAFLGVKLFRVSLRSFQGTLWILQAAMLLSIFACLICKHFDYLRAHLFEVELLKLMGQMGTFTLFFLPFFCAYGLSEYVGYQLGTRQLRGRMRLVYAIYLFGAAFAYLFLREAQSRLGITGVLDLSLLCVAVASLLLSTGPWLRGGFTLECAALLAVLFLPGRETRFLDLYKGQGSKSTKEYSEKGYEPAFQKWGRYSLTEVMYSPQEKQFAGFYNDLMQWEYSRQTGFSERMLGAMPINCAKPTGRIAIIGAGGGRQVRWARQPRFSFQEILALELEPAVFEAVRGPLRDEFDSVYEGDNVRPIVREARGYMEERTDEAFDLIFMPSVGGYPQMMLEPGNMIRTVDAYRTLKSRLTSEGILAIWYPVGLDPKGILTDQYVRTLGEQGLGMKTQAYVSWYEYVILAAKNPGTLLPTAEAIDSFLTQPDDPSGLPPVTDSLARPRALFVSQDPGFKPITDDQPFLAGNVRHIFSLEQLYVLFLAVGCFLSAVGGALVLGLRRSGDPGIPGRPYWQVAGSSLLIGANFVLFEHYVVLQLFKKLYVFQDALVLGAISFLVVSGCGSVLITQRTRLTFQVIAAVLLIPLVFMEGTLSAGAVILLMAPVAFATGSFFPALFELAVKNPLGVFAMDAVGAAIGSTIAFFIPIAFGFSTFFPIGAVIFLITSLATWRFCAIKVDTGG